MADPAKHFLINLSVLQPLEPQELEAQRRFLSRLTAEGLLLLAAVLPGTPGRGLAVLAAKSIEDAQKVYDDAPVVKSGKATIEIQELRLTAGVLAG